MNDLFKCKQRSFEKWFGFYSYVHFCRNNHGTKSMLSTPKGANMKKKLKLSFTSNPLDQTMIHPSSYDTASRYDYIYIDIYIAKYNDNWSIYGMFCWNTKKKIVILAKENVVQLSRR